MAKMESVRNVNGDYGVDNTCTVGKVGMLYGWGKCLLVPISISVNVSLLLSVFAFGICCCWFNLYEDWPQFVLSHNFLQIDSLIDDDTIYRLHNSGQS